MLISISKQSGESVQSDLKKRRKATVGRICRKGRFQAWSEWLTHDESGESTELMGEVY